MELVKASEIEDIVCEDMKDDEIKTTTKLGEDMIKLCAEKGGVGLSAPQVGIKKNVFIWRIDEDMFQIVVNPKFFPNEKKTTNVIEACLSYPDEHYFVKRYKYVRGVFYVIQPNKTLKKVFKNFRGDDAIVFQHECQHLVGKTIRTEGELMRDFEPEEMVKVNE